jgi:hypothetical protein
MGFKIQFSSAGGLTQRWEEKSHPARAESSDTRERALRSSEFFSKRGARRRCSVVTSVEKKEAAPRSELRPPTPNQTPEPTRLGRPFQFAHAAHRVAHL